ncbi:nuclear GTPase SLIP-GC-like isoform X3 [Acanthochromis polyacanthus]|uniref:nuclear GTPase SLIP-GC-like isoform X3 n=1 Tax=Acanthochromis polyacanthus TaxID=80966 RepID=UPI002234E76B|nr:nuclear GTPase SLIP-GC-like isoform X3 [Acanthochromis polyacanthus]
MDDFVCNKLTEWGLSELIDRFKDHSMDKESLYDLDDQDIKDLIPAVGPRAKFKKRLKQLKEEQNTNQEAANSPVPVSPATSDKESVILSDVKDIMGSVLKKLHHQDKTNLNNFLRTKIHDLKTDKKELIGVFGRTGAGKSSLINAVLGEEDLLPSGDVIACTSVMIKVEANMRSSKYEADIEFITSEEWKDEIWTMKQFLGNADEEWQKDADCRDVVEKLSALYGEEWKHKSPENLVDVKYFSEIEEFLQSQRKTLTCGSAKELSAKLVRYTRSTSRRRQGEVTRCFWPLVKCVTVKVPNNDLLQHVTLVDLPGNGDRNKSRAKMWKGIVGDCSTVWIVTEINRAASEDDAWEILESTCSLMGNGGQCQRIHFICTKSDVIGGSNDDADVRARIVQRNATAKEEVIVEYGSLNQVKKHFSDDCFKVFTVSSDEFLKGQHLNPEDTEIPQLQDFLKGLNDCHSETLNYVTGAYGILSLMHGANSTEGNGKKTDVCAELENNLSHQLGQVKQAVEDAHKAFETRLIEGVEKSQSSCERSMSSFLYSSARGFHRTLKCVVQKDGVHKTTKGKQINLNVKLASWLTDGIDEEFRKTFPNEGKCGSFNGVISSFSLDTERLMKENQSPKLQLIFLKTEEEKMKTKLNKTVRERKKTIYNSLTETIEKTMLDCYKRAAEFSGPDSLKYMRDTILEHVRVSKDMMFEEAKAAMLKLLNDLKEEILKTLQETLEESIELSLKTDDNSIPDVPDELEKVLKYYNELKDNSKELIFQLG